MNSNSFTVVISIYINTSIQNLLIFFKSISRSSLKPNEIVLVIDGPIKNDLYKVINLNIKKLNLLYKINFQILENEINKGSAHAYNLAVKMSKNEFILRCDADDFSYKERFFKIISVLNKGYSLCGSQMLENIDGKKYLKKLPITYQNISKIMKLKNPFNHPSIGFKKSIFEELGGYTDVYLKEDYTLWMKWVSKYNNVLNLNEILVANQKNNTFILRRGGFRNIYTELLVYKYLIKYRFVGILDGLLIFFSRVIILLLPRNLLKLFYLKILRNIL